jgi:hypothetical protein
MTQYVRCLALTKAIVESVPDVGHVYDHLWIMDPDGEKRLLDLFLITIAGTKQYRGWMITGTNTGVTRRILTASQDEVVLPFQLHGYRSVNADQSSEAEFYALCETLSDSLSAKIKAGETEDLTDPGYVAIAMPAQIRQRKYAKFAGTTFHYAVIEYALRVHVKVTRT